MASAEAINLGRPYWILDPVSCHTPEAVTTVFKCSWGWTQKASETCRVMLQILINVLPSCIMLVLYIHEECTLHPKMTSWTSCVTLKFPHKPLRSQIAIWITLHINAIRNIECLNYVERTWISMLQMWANQLPTPPQTMYQSFNH